MAIFSQRDNIAIFLVKKFIILVVLLVIAAVAIDNSDIKPEVKEITKKVENEQL
jgi:hypothetical protein